MTSLASSQ
jgi:hypothetical protein